MILWERLGNRASKFKMLVNSNDERNVLRFCNIRAESGYYLHQRENPGKIVTQVKYRRWRLLTAEGIRPPHALCFGRTDGLGASLCV